MGNVGIKDISTDYSFLVNVLAAGTITVMQSAKGHLCGNQCDSVTREFISSTQKDPLKVYAAVVL